MAGKEDELTLPKATVAKFIKESLPDDMRCAADTRDLLIDCCIEFVQLVSSEAMEICTKDKKKTIAPDHVLSSLSALGFSEYTGEVKAEFANFKEQSGAKAGKSKKKLKESDLSEAELQKEQEELFARARQAYSAAPEEGVAADQ